MNGRNAYGCPIRYARDMRALKIKRIISAIEYLEQRDKK